MKSTIKQENDRTWKRAADFLLCVQALYPRGLQYRQGL